MTDWVSKPEITHLGMIEGQWPVQAFTNEDQAARWAASGKTPNERRHVWGVLRLDLGPRLTGVRIPEQSVLERAEVPK